MTAVAVSIVAGWIATRRGTSRPEVVGAVGWGVIAAPLPTAAVMSVVMALRRWRRAAAATRVRRDADGETVLLADLVALGVASGKTVRGALEAARSHLQPMLAVEVEELLGEMNRVGTAPALIAAGGRLTDFGRVVAAAVTSGAPVVVAITAHADRLRHARHAERVATARRLPVRLLLPLALLILPGFVVLAVGPAVLQALARLAPIP
jgi:hypothetical protein